MYAPPPSFILGFHGCYQSLADRIFAGSERLVTKKNDYDWLGHGIYFWENSPDRALEWASAKLQRDQKARKSAEKAAVVGAVIDLGYCLNLHEARALKSVREAHDLLESAMSLAGEPMPENKSAAGEPDRVLRHLDCAVMEFLHNRREAQNSGSKASPLRVFDSVRAPFFEGHALYTGAGFQDKNHVQICVRNPNCIKGYFRVLEPDPNHAMP